MTVSWDMLKENIATFDWIIFAAFGVNAVLFLILVLAERITLGYKHPLVITLYRFYENITSIFPLLGVFGTVMSLMNMVGGGDIEISAFSAALTSTFWGLIAAMMCKFLDGFVSAHLDTEGDMQSQPVYSHKSAKSRGGDGDNKEGDK